MVRTHDAEEVRLRRGEVAGGDASAPRGAKTARGATQHVHNILTKLDVINRILAFGEVVCVIICGRPRKSR